MARRPRHLQLFLYLLIDFGLDETFDGHLTRSIHPRNSGPANFEATDPEIRSVRLKSCSMRVAHCGAPSCWKKNQVVCSSTAAARLRQKRRIL